MKYVISREFNIPIGQHAEERYTLYRVRVEALTGPVVAEFPMSPIGLQSLGHWKSGVARDTTACIYDADNKRYIVGTLDQLMNGGQG